MVYRFAAAATLALVTSLHAAQNGLIIEEAEEWVEEERQVYRDPQASNERVGVFQLRPKPEDSVKRIHGLPDNHPLALQYGTWTSKDKTRLEVTPELPAGVYEITARVTARPVELMHRLRLLLTANGVTAIANSSWFELSEEYIPLTIQVHHGGGKMAIALKGFAITGFDGMLGTKSEAEKALLDNLQAGIGQEAFAENEDGEVGEEVLGELDGTPLLSQIDFHDLIVACDRVEIRKIADVAARVTYLEVDKVHYRPNERLVADVKVAAVKPGAYTLTVLEVWEHNGSRVIHEKDLVLDSTIKAVRFESDLAPVEYGRQILATIRPKGQPLPAPTAVHLANPMRHFPGCAYEVFGVSKNPYQIGITAGGGPQDTANLPREASAALMRANKLTYGNYFERFAWAPSDFGEQASDEELFWSGQTQYAGSITGMRTMIEEAHRVGVKALTYANPVASGIDGIEVFRKHPDFFHTNAAQGLSTDILGSLFLERWEKKEYDAAPPLQGRWRNWYHFRCNWEGRTDQIDYTAADIAKAAEIFGWDGVRWDGHFVGQMGRFKEQIGKLRSDVIHGYNIAFADPGSEIFLPRGNWEDFHECARGGGMMMDESVRDYAHTNWSQRHWTKAEQIHFYRAICREADYIRRIEGIPLFIMFDMASQMDHIYNVYYGLAAGQLYTYHNSPGDFPYGRLSKWLTRYSAVVWTPAKRVREPGKLFRVDDPSTGEDAKAFPLRWRESCWIRDVTPKHKQLHIRVVNPPRYKSFCTRAQPPSQIRRNVVVSVPIPDGTDISFAMHASPDLVTGHEVLRSETKEGRCQVEVPTIKTFSVLVFDLTRRDGDFDGEPYPLTTPVKDAKAYMKSPKGQELLKEMEEKAVQAGIAKSTGLYVDLEKRGRFKYPAPANLDAEDEADEKHTVHLDEKMGRQPIVIPRDGIMDVHHGRGIFAWLNGVERAIGIVGGGNLSRSWMHRNWYGGRVRRNVDDFPATYAELARHDVVILDNLHAEELGLYRRVMLKDYVKAGGGLLVFGGHFNLSYGLDHGTWLAEMLPVEIKGFRQLSQKNGAGFRLQMPDVEHFGSGIDWGQAGACATVDRSPPKPGAKVLLRAGEHPAIVAGTFGKGRVIAVMMNHHGLFDEGVTPYWKWSDWPKVVGRCLHWLGSTYAEQQPAPDVKRELDPELPQPFELQMEAEDLAPAELSQDLKAACGNVIDSDSARALLECALEHSGRIDDIEIMSMVTRAIEPYIDDGFASYVDGLLANELAEFKAMGFRLVAMTKQDEHLAAAVKGVQNERPMVRRAAILALGAMPAKSQATKLLHEQATKGQAFDFLAATMLMQNKIVGGLEQALELYPAHLRRVRDLRCIEMGLENSRFGAMSFKLTRKAVRELDRKLVRKRRTRAWADESLRVFNDVVRGFSADERRRAVAALAKAENEDVVPLGYTVVAQMKPADLTAAKSTLAEAKLPGLRVLGQ